MRVIEDPSVIAELIFLISAMLATASSILRVTSVSRMEGVAPGRPTATSIVGSETSGRSEIGSLWRPQNPAIVSSTNASTEGSGCWMPQRERVMARRPGSGSGAVDDLHQVAVT